MRNDAWVRVGGLPILHMGGICSLGFELTLVQGLDNCSPCVRDGNLSR